MKRIPGIRISVRRQVSLAVLISVAGAGAAIAFRNSILALGSWGYVGALGISAISSATIFLPGPGVAILVVMAQDFNPLLLGIVAGVGGTIGSSTAYLVGRLGTGVVEEKRFYKFVLWSMRRFGGLILFVFTLIPFLPMDASSILAGVCRYPLSRFYLYVGIANVIKMIVLFYGFTVLQAEFQIWFLNWVEKWAWIPAALRNLYSF